MPLLIEKSKGAFFMTNDPVDNIMEKNSEFCTLKYLGTDVSNSSFGLFTTIRG